MIRVEAQLSVSRFAELIGVPRRTYHYRLGKWRAGDLEKGPWPAPVVDRIEPTVAKYAESWEAWGIGRSGRSPAPTAGTSGRSRR